MTEPSVINLNFRQELPLPLRYVGFVDYYGPLDLRTHSAHRHAYYQFFLVTEGQFLFVSETGEEVWLQAGDALIFRPGVMHNWHVEPRATCRTFMVFFDPIPPGPFQDLEERLNREPLPGHWQLAVDLAQIRPLLDMIREECEKSAAMAASVVYGLTMAAIAICTRALAPGRGMGSEGGLPASVLAALKFIEEHFAEAISVADIARHAGIGTGRLTELFREHVGTSPLRYLNTHRTDRAKILLLYSPLKLAEVASQCGFNSLPYFCRKFAKETGVTPGDFRRGRFDHILPERDERAHSEED
jgi:AraC-like DNA-binding protein